MANKSDMKAANLSTRFYLYKSVLRLFNASARTHLGVQQTAASETKIQGTFTVSLWQWHCPPRQSHRVHTNANIDFALPLNTNVTIVLSNFFPLEDFLITD